MKLTPVHTHHTGIFRHSTWHDTMQKNAKDLKQQVNEDTAFFISPYAGFFYLITGLRNPTPYDWVSSNIMRSEGQSAVIEAISQRRIRTVYLHSMYKADPIRPIQLEEYVQSHMVRKGIMGSFIEYRGIDAE